MSDFTNNMFSNRDEYCYAIELALDTAKMEAETVTTEITTNNQSKEDIMFNINKCNINVKGHQCKRNRQSGCTVTVNGELIYMCFQHWQKYVLSSDADTPVYHFTNIKPVQEDNTMKTNIRTREQIVEELNYAKEQMEEMREHPYTTYAIANGDRVGDAIDMLTAELKEFDMTNITNKKEETKMDTTIVTVNYKDKGYIRCPKCSKELLNSDPENDWTRGAYHRSVDEVRLCQTGTTVKPALTNGFVKASIWKGDNGDTMETMRFATRKEAVVYQIAVKGNQPKYDEKRGCWTVTHKLS